MAILGIKTSTPSTLVKESEIDNLFSSDSENSSFSIEFTFPPNTLPMPNPVIGLSQPTPANFPLSAHINSLEEALPRINTFISQFKELNLCNIPKSYTGDVYFIPEQSVPIEFSSLLAQFYRSLTEGNNFENDQIYEDIVATDLSSFPETISAQVELLKFIKNHDHSLDSFLNEKVDSRILALIHFALSKNQDAKIVVYHLLLAIEEMLKFPNLAPIAIFFPDFTHTEVLKLLAFKLVDLFPHNPILPSCIEKLSDFSPEAREALNMIPSSDDDLSDDFSSDFFENLKPSTTFNPVICLQNTNDSDLLDFSSEMSKPIITLSEPPTTMTFSLENGSNQMGMPYFQEWVESLRKFEYGDDFLSKFLINKDPVTYISELPDTPEISMISSQLPVVHLINSVSFKLIDKGCPFPELLKVEFDIQDALLHNNTELLDTSLSYLSSLTEQYKPKSSLDSSGIYEPIAPLSQLRSKPSMIQDDNLNIEAALAISDFEIAMHGRSLLNLTPICKQTPDANICGQIANIHYRANYLFSIYSTQTFSPYISYRIAFALALNLMDRNPQLASNFIFEGLYILLESLPLNASPIARSGYLLAAEIFDQINSYYYSALMIDTYLITDTKDSSASTSLARMATRNNDYYRAVYFYTQSLKTYIARKHIDEALYLSQIIAMVYAENGLKNLSISLLSAILYRSYSITLGLGPIKKSAGTMQNRKSKPMIMTSTTTTNPEAQQQQPFLPDPHTLNTSLLGLTLTELLLNERMFDIAQVMLNHIQEGKVGIKRLSSFMQCRFCYKENRVQDFFDLVSKSDFKLDLRRKSNPRLSILQASTCDTNACYLRMLTKINFRQRNYIDSLFWSEMIMHNSCKGSLKEFGYGNFWRALSLYEIWLRGDLKLETTPNDLKQRFGSFIQKSKKSDTISKETLFNEAISSLLIARQCFDRCGVFHLYSYATIMICDFFIHNEFNYLSSQKDDKKTNLEIHTTPINMFTNFLNATEPFSMPFHLTPIRITLEYLINYFKSIERILSKSLSPINIIHYQTLKSRFHYLKNDTTLSQLYFGFSLNNIQKYFVCGSDFLPVNISLSSAHRMHHILESLIHLMFNYEPSYINDHLFLIDIINSVKLLESQKRKSREQLNTKLIPSNIDIQPSSALLANPNYPDFECSLASITSQLGSQFGITQNTSSANLLMNVNNESSENEQNEVDPLTIIHNCLTQIEANIRLYESEKLREADLSWKNRKLCLKMEMAAETIRRQRQTELPTETHFSSVALTSPIIKGIIFVLKVYNQIVVYCPESGIKRIVDINQKERQNPISIKIRSESINDQIGLFNNHFAEFFLSLTSSTLSKAGKGHAARLQKEIEGLLFTSIISLKPQKQVPDNHSLGCNRMFTKTLKGALSTMDCGGSLVILITSVDMNCIPFETMLNKYTVIRSFTYLRLLLKPINDSIIPAIRRKSLKYASIHSPKTPGQETQYSSYSTPNTTPPKHSNSPSKITQNHSLLDTPHSLHPIPLPNIRTSTSTADNSLDVFPSLIKSHDCYRDDTSLHPSPRPNKISQWTSASSNLVESTGDSHNSASMTKSTSNGDFQHQPVIAQINVDNYLSTIKPLIIRSHLDDPGRYATPLYEFIYEFGGKLRYDYTANADRMKEMLIQPIFRSNETNEYYMQKFEYITIVDNSKFMPLLPSNLVIYPYSDLCEIPFELESQMRRFTASSFMFIPNCYFKVALKTIKYIFKRHERRIRYAMSNEKEMKSQLEMLRDKYRMLTTIQATLINNLQIPIPLFMPVI